MNNAENISRIAITTGGGDAPGLNAVIRAVVVSALARGWTTYGIREGYNGVLEPGNYPEGGLFEIRRSAVEGITHLGGTILGTTNRFNPVSYPVKGEDGQIREVDRTDELVDALASNGIDALVAVGGDGSLAIANALSEKGVRVVGVPKTIDNDLHRTVVTFGFDTAVSFATSCVDRLHSTADAHQRIMVVEVMGRYAGWIALNVGVSGGADAILIPEIPYDLDKVAERVRRCSDIGQNYAIVVVAEGASPIGGSRQVLEKEIGKAERLGGIGDQVAHQLQQLVGKEARAVVLGHLLRGGSPTTFDRLISLRFGAAVVRALADGQSGVMVALDPPTVRYVPLKEVTRGMKSVPLDCDTVATARDLGISFGD